MEFFDSEEITGSGDPQYNCVQAGCAQNDCTQSTCVQYSCVQYYPCS